MTTVAVETKITFSHHAVERYRERAFPAADLQLARARLEALASSARVAAHPPRWCAAKAQQEAELYLVIGDLVFPLVRTGEDQDHQWLAMTCIARGGISARARRRRNASRVPRRRPREENRRRGPRR